MRNAQRVFAREALLDPRASVGARDISRAKFFRGEKFGSHIGSTLNVDAWRLKEMLTLYERRVSNVNPRKTKEEGNIRSAHASEIDMYRNSIKFRSFRDSYYRFFFFFFSFQWRDAL